MAYDLSWEPRGLYRRYWGQVSIAERRESFERVFADPRFDELLYAITDYLDVQHYEITPEATVEIAALHVGPTATNPQIVIAAVVTDPRIVQAIEHFISLDMITAPYRMFATVAAAREWVSQAQRQPLSRAPHL
jgi:hypothetical protein